MITHLNGILAKKSPTEAIIDVHGVGYSVFISLSTYEKLPEINQKISMLTYFHIREDIQQLYGFVTEFEREVFRLLISVSGIGPKMAQTILSGIRPEELSQTIAQGAVGALTSIPGVGKKTAERLVVELKDKFGKVVFETETLHDSSPSSIRSEALNALVSLGLSREKAELAIRNVLNSSEKVISVELLIKKALQFSNK